MRELPALVTVVAAIVAPLAISGCYSVPDLVDAGGVGAEGGSETGRDGSGTDSSAGSSSGSADAGSSSGHVDGSVKPDAACMGILCPCINANDCASGVCAQSNTVGTGVSGQAGGSFCTQPCCISSDCPSGTVCYASGEGGQYCVDPAWLGRSKPAPGPTFLGGSTCSTGSQCSSGLCVNGACADTCCSLFSATSECAGGRTCTFGTFPGKVSFDTHFAPQCAPLSGNTQTGNPCSANNVCQGGLCYYFGGSLGSECTEPCKNSTDCGGGSVCAWDVMGSDAYAACFPLGTLSGFGATCSKDTDCASMVCNMTNCTGPCFSNGDCTGVTGWRCTPGIVIDFMTVGNYTVLSCGP